MKQTLLNTALTGTLALLVVVGAGTASAAENNLYQGYFNLGLQDFLNDNGSGNGSDNNVTSYHDDDKLDLDATNSGNHSGNGNGSRNVVGSGNDNDRVDVDAGLYDVGNDKSTDDNDHVDLDLYAKDVGNNKSRNTYKNDMSWSEDSSFTLDNVAIQVNTQSLAGIAAAVHMKAGRGNITTGNVDYGTDTNMMAAGNMTDSLNTGAGTVAAAASAIQANGNFRIGN